MPADPPVTQLNFRFKVIPVCSQPTHPPPISHTASHSQPVRASHSPSFLAPLLRRVTLCVCSGYTGSRLPSWRAGAEQLSSRADAAGVPRGQKGANGGLARAQAADSNTAAAHTALSTPNRPSQQRAAHIASSAGSSAQRWNVRPQSEQSNTRPAWQVSGAHGSRAAVVHGSAVRSQQDEREEGKSNERV